MSPSTQLRIAMILPAGREYSDRLTEGIIATAALDPRIVLMDLPYHVGTRQPGSGVAGNCGGALVWLDSGDTWVRGLLKADILVVNANSSWAGIVPSVTIDGSGLARLAAAHLLDLGRSHAAYVGWRVDKELRALNPAVSFGACCREAGVVFAAHETGTLRGTDDRTLPVSPAALGRLKAFLSKLPKPAAVWCEDDRLARLVCDLAMELSLRVPADLAVLGTGDLRESLIRNPTISTIPLPAQLVGREMLRMLVGLLDGGPPPVEPMKIPVPPVMVRASTVPETGANEIFCHARAWIREHACKGATVNNLMDRMPMSQRVFSKRFAEIFGRTPGEEIRQIRLTHAKSYLTTTTLSIDRVSALCGYDQQAKFSNFFKRETGMTPSDYRRQGPAPL